MNRNLLNFINLDWSYLLLLKKSGGFFLLTKLLFELLLLYEVLNPLFFLKLKLLLLYFLQLLFGLIDFFFNNSLSFKEQLLQFRVISKAQIHQSALCSVPSLLRISILLVLFKELPHLFLNGLFAALGKASIKVINYLLLAFEGAMHHFDKLNKLRIDGVYSCRFYSLKLLLFSIVLRLYPNWEVLPVFNKRYSSKVLEIAH